MRKICIVTPEYPPFQWGGLAKTVGRVSRQLRDLHFDVHVAYFTIVDNQMVFFDENHTYAKHDGITVHHIKVGREEYVGCRQIWDCPHTFTLQMIYHSLEKLHYSQQFDAFHSFFLYPMGFVAGLIARRFTIPHITTIVGNDVKKYILSPEKTAVCRSGLENSDIVAALSNDLIEMADALVSIKHKAYVILNSVEIPNFPRKRNLGIPKIGCAGIFKFAKGVPYLLKAIGQVVSEQPVCLELVGNIRESEREVLDKFLSDSSIRDHVIFKDAMGSQDLQQWLSGLSLFVLPSITEGCPNILMEALAMGLPCVATDTGANAVLIKSGISGIIVPWGSSAALKGAILELLGNVKMAEMMGTNAKLRMMEFSYEQEQNAWSGIYNKLFGPC